MYLTQVFYRATIRNVHVLLAVKEVYYLARTAGSSGCQKKPDRTTPPLLLLSIRLLRRLSFSCTGSNANDRYVAASSTSGAVPEAVSVNMRSSVSKPAGTPRSRASRLRVQPAKQYEALFEARACP